MKKILAAFGFVFAMTLGGCQVPTATGGVSATGFSLDPVKSDFYRMFEHFETFEKVFGKPEWFKDVPPPKRKPPLTFKLLFVIKPETHFQDQRIVTPYRGVDEIEEYRRSMDAAETETLRLALEKQFPELVRDLSGDQITVESTVRVSDVPVTRAQCSGVERDGAGNLLPDLCELPPEYYADELQLPSQSHRFDGVFVYWDQVYRRKPNATNFNGLYHWPASRESGFAPVATVFRPWNAEDRFKELREAKSAHDLRKITLLLTFVHEWLHQLEHFYWKFPEVRLNFCGGDGILSAQRMIRNNEYFYFRGGALHCDGSLNDDAEFGAFNPAYQWENAEADTRYADYLGAMLQGNLTAPGLSGTFGLGTEAFKYGTIRDFLYQFPFATLSNGEGRFSYFPKKPKKPTNPPPGTEYYLDHSRQNPGWVLGPAKMVERGLVQNCELAPDCVFQHSLGFQKLLSLERL